jgi:hypothetical protein
MYCVSSWVHSNIAAQHEAWQLELFERIRQLVRPKAAVRTDPRGTGGDALQHLHSGALQ